LLTLRCFDDAVSDFQKAVELIQGKPDQIEPDGIPNARNTPTSTLQSNIWYHLGLAYYLKGDFRSALEAYRKCMLVSKNPDMLVATANWHYITARRTGENEEAQKVLASIEDGLDIIENGSYYDLIKLYQGKLEKIDLAGAKGDNLSSASVLYGVGNWVLLNNDPLLAQLYFERILAGDQWSSFGYIAAETELARIMKKIED
jgi:tetratricopeptide (TPR) repeat protein